MQHRPVRDATVKGQTHFTCLVVGVSRAAALHALLQVFERSLVELRVIEPTITCPATAVHMLRENIVWGEGLHDLLDGPSQAHVVGTASHVHRNLLCGRCNVHLVNDIELGKLEGLIDLGQGRGRIKGLDWVRHAKNCSASSNVSGFLKFLNWSHNSRVEGTRCFCVLL